MASTDYRKEPTRLPTGDAAIRARTIISRIWQLRAERDAAKGITRWVEISHEIDEETERLGHLQSAALAVRQPYRTPSQPDVP